ncbi:TonB-dependent receptor [Dyadobacter sp. CY312]|uniref:SusC/RagA family TonB-linked outer membrane protein n=1 Tax=Dyadobacter sp. CY312 TaxID=2907303 RepID=UPI001F236D93|nr:TonB-dependent receptor [Dyadobacter sp. CY312]MCE7041295.1 TonB-dependent receptor [Dyadobacter sp. CY312]
MVNLFLSFYRHRDGSAEKLEPKRNASSRKRQQLFLLLFLFVCGQLYAQDVTLSGVVTDGKGGSLPGVSIAVKGSTKGTTTDMDGKYTLSAPSGSVLQFSFIGFTSKEVTVGSETKIDVVLTDDAKALEEVVVIGYGTVKKKDLTGSVSSLQSKDFNKGVITSPDQLIQGRTPGVMVINNTGQPGGAATVRIRGNSSIRAGNNPLFVLDGIPLSGSSARPGGSGGFGSDGGNPLAYLNPSDIASMDILKDASATAIYGSRGANGVVIITTKRGASGAPTVSFNASTGVSSLLRRPEVLSADEFRQAAKYYAPDADPNSYDFKGNVNAFDEITRTAPVQNYSVAVTGGTDNGKYRISAGYMDQKGIIKNSDLKKYTASLNTNFKFLESKRLGLDFGVLFTQTDENIVPIDVGRGADGNLISMALAWNPTRPLIKDDGGFTYINAITGNPLANLHAYKDNATVNTIVANIAPSFKITNDLEYKFVYSVTRQMGIRKGRLLDGIVNENTTNNGFAFVGNNQETNQQLTHTLSYNKQLNPSLSVNAVAGYEYLSYAKSWNTVNASGFPNVGLDFYDYLNYSITNNRGANSYRSPSDELQSYFVRAGVNYLDKYLVTATVRRDGSTKFGENNKYANFPALAVAWNVSNEEFLKGNTTLNNVKVRVGWGKTGNREFPSGASRDRYAFGNQSVSQVNYGNPDLKWESSETINAGIDFGLFQSRIIGSIDYFNKKTTDALFERTLAQPAPNGRVWVNLDGEVVNKGVEVALTGTVLETKDWVWNLSANATFLKNSVSGLPGFYETAQLRGQGFSGVLGQRMVSGQPLNVWYLATYAGIDPATGTSMYVGADGNASTSVDPAQNKSYVGSPNPTTLLGISTDVTYKKFSAVVNMNGAFGHYLFNNTFATVLGINNMPSRNMAKDFYKTDIKESTSNSAAPSTRYLEKGDYMKMSNLTLSYRVGSVGKAFKNLNISLTGQNLFVLTKYKGFDPEVNTDGSSSDIPSLGIEYVPYPSARTFLLGVNFSL